MCCSKECTKTWSREFVFQVRSRWKSYNERTRDEEIIKLLESGSTIESGTKIGGRAYFLTMKGKRLCFKAFCTLINCSEKKVRAVEQRMNELQSDGCAMYDPQEAIIELESYYISKKQRMFDFFTGIRNSDAFSEQHPKYNAVRVLSSMHTRQELWRVFQQIESTYVDLSYFLNIWKTNFSNLSKLVSFVLFLLDLIVCPETLDDIVSCETCLKLGKQIQEATKTSDSEMIRRAQEQKKEHKRVGIRCGSMIWNSASNPNFIVVWKPLIAII